MSASIRLAPHALLLSVAVPLVAGTVIGYAVRGAVERPVDVPDEAKAVAAQSVAPSAAPADGALAAAKANVETLRARVSELERLLNEREESIARLSAESSRPRETPPEPPAAENADAQARPPRESWAERMERMKREEPERYEEMQKRQGEFRARLHADNEERGNFFASIDTARMTDEQKAGHQRLLSIIKLLDSSMDKFGPGAQGQMTDEERQEVFAAMRDVVPLMEQERRYILEEVGREYGEDGPAFANYIQDVISHTSPIPRMMGRGRGGPPRGGRGGPGGEPGGQR